MIRVQSAAHGFESRLLDQLYATTKVNRQRWVLKKNYLFIDGDLFSIASLHGPAAEASLCQRPAHRATGKPGTGTYRISFSSQDCQDLGFKNGEKPVLDPRTCSWIRNYFFRIRIQAKLKKKNRYPVTVTNQNFTGTENSKYGGLFLVMSVG